MFTKSTSILERVIPDIKQYLRLWEEREEAEDGLKDLSFLYI